MSARSHTNTPAEATFEQDDHRVTGTLSAENACGLEGVAFTAHVADSRVPNTAVFVRPRLNESGRSQIADAGSVPRWRRDGTELFFIAPAGQLMSQHVTAGHAVGAPTQLCPTGALATSGLAGQAYDAAPTGDRFLIKVPARRSSIVIVTGIR